MLRIECYPILDGLVVNFVGVPLRKPLSPTGEGPAKIVRVIPVETMESLGLDDAFRDVLMDVITEYPGLLKYALG